MGKCLICQEPVTPFMDFGRMPIANAFLLEKDFPGEYFFNLATGLCEGCGMVQLMERVDPKALFHDHYAFFSSTSARMAEHFREFADLVMNRYLKSENPFVVEIGCNDGILLRHFARAGIRHLGIEPSANVAQAARDAGIEVATEFFTMDLAEKILDLKGPADVFLGANVMCHLPNMVDVIEAVKRLLSPNGLIIFEDPYLGDIVEKTSYDQIYDEHVFYFCLSSLRSLFDKFELEVVDVTPQPVHGGSMRYVVGRKGVHKQTPAVEALRKKEAEIDLTGITTFLGLAERIHKSKTRLMEILEEIRHQGKRIVGYGATSKSTTVTNFCGITRAHLDYISDTTPIKQGKFSPGAHIPIRPYEEFQKNYPDYSLLFAWNHAEEIFAKEEGFRNAGGKWIVYVPEAKVL